MYLFVLFLMVIIFMFLYSQSVLNYLICLEFLSLIIFVILMSNYFYESVMEMIVFMVIIVGESLLGLILMLIKTSLSGSDLLEYNNVF